MRLILAVFSLLLLSCTANAQKLTGIWRGYFSSSSGIYREGAREEMYKYEIQIDHQSNNSLKGVTYSYKSTVFYGKADLTGIFTTGAKSLILKETRLVDLKVAGGQSDPCLMTCYLDYSKAGNMEFLEGTFISINAKDKSDCGSGKVYLEKVTTSDFMKEAFLKKLKDIDSAVPSKRETAKPLVKQPPALPPQKNTGRPPVVVPSNPTTSTTKPKEKIKPVTRDDKPKIQSPHIDKVPEQAIESPKPDSFINKRTETGTEQKIIPATVPKVLLERQNELVTTIVTDQEDVQIDFFDNGIIDNDTISIYHNNVLVVSKNRLSNLPITVKFKCSKTDNRHEIIVVAENLGDIPPNTALMVIDARGKKRQEVFLASTEQQNAKVIILYKPKE